MRQKIILLPLVMLFASSCGLFTHPIYGGGRNAANDQKGIVSGAYASGSAQPEVSDICETDSLGVIRNRASALKGDCPNCAEDTIILVSEFFNEIDASYRMASTSCRAYSRCMQNNFYDEGQCRSSMASWERSRGDFADLSRELREIEAEVRRDRIAKRGRRGAYINRYEKCDCSQSTGGVFANCCDRDSDSRYHRK